MLLQPLGESILFESLVSMQSDSPSHGGLPAFGTRHDDRSMSEVSGKSDDGKPVKRGRKSRPKVKTGCANCKQRRIKCDEARPSCTQCVRAKKTCTGYPPPPRSIRPEHEVRIAPKPATPSLSPAPRLSPASRPSPSVTPSPLTSNQNESPRPALLSREPTLPPPRARAQTSQSSAASSPAPYGSPVHYSSPAISSLLNATEYFYFQIFQKQTARELSGYFDSSFYTERVLEACNTEAAIRHAAIALGALQKTLEQPERNSNSPTDASRAHEEHLRHWQVAVRQYSEACNAMMAMRDPDPISLRTQLMASVLLASFDSFIGDFRQAISQIQSGLDLLERIRFIARLPAYGIATGTPEEELTIIFMRMAIQAKSYDLSFHFPEPYVVRFTSPAQHQARLQRLNQPDRQQGLDPSLHNQNPHRLSPGAEANAPHATPSASLSSSKPFLTVHEARLAHDRLNERLVRFQESLNIRPKERSRMAMPPSWLQEIGFFKEQLVAWALAFEPLFQSRHAPNFTRKERARVSVLKIAHLTARVISAVQFSSSEVVFDEHHGVFQSMIDLVMEIVQEEEAEGASICHNESAFCHHQRQLPTDYISAGVFSPCHIKPTFSMDQGIVAPLFVIATKCRVPALRRQAIELLKGCGRREGMWDSELTARISHWIMTLEEILPDGLGSEPSPGNAGTPSPYDDRRPRDSAGYYNDVRAFMALSAGDAAPAEKRVTLKSVDFDLRARRAVVAVGTRDSPEDLPDLRYRSTRITW